MTEKMLKLLNSGLVGDAIENIAKVVTVFNPTLGSGLMMASDIADKLNGIDDDFLEKEVIGIGGSVRTLKNMLDTKSVDFEILGMVVKNLESIQVFLEKSNKLCK